MVFCLSKCPQFSIKKILTYIPLPQVARLFFPVPGVSRCGMYLLLQTWYTEVSPLLLRLWVIQLENNPDTVCMTSWTRLPTICHSLSEWVDMWYVEGRMSPEKYCVAVKRVRWPNEPYLGGGSKVFGGMCRCHSLRELARLNNDNARILMSDQQS